MAIRAALNAARWLLPLALVAIIKMHYNPHSLASTISSFPLLLLLQRLLFTQLQPVLFLWEASLSSFPLFRASVSSSASRPFLRLFTLYVAENSTLTPASPSVPSSLPPPSIFWHLPFLLYTGGHFQFKFASAQEHGAFHRRAHVCPDSIKDEFRHLINLPTGAHVYKVHKCWDKSLFPNRYTEFENSSLGKSLEIFSSQVPWLI